MHEFGDNRSADFDVHICHAVSMCGSMRQVYTAPLVLRTFLFHNDMRRSALLIFSSVLNQLALHLLFGFQHYALHGTDIKLTILITYLGAAHPLPCSYVSESPHPEYLLPVSFAFIHFNAREASSFHVNSSVTRHRDAHSTHPRTLLASTRTSAAP